MRTQTANNTFDERILLFLPTTDAERIIADSFLTSEDHFHIREIEQYSLNVISVLDKFPLAESSIRMHNPSPSDVNNLDSFEQSRIFKITTLPTKKLKEPIEAILEPDDEGYIIRTIDFPLYGYGDDSIEAIQNLKYEIESLYDDLMEDDNFSDEWLRYKSVLLEIICAD